MRKILLALMVIACSASASMAQKTFQGTIEYDIQIGGGDQAAFAFLDDVQQDGIKNRGRSR
jgi:hypothetical protein